MSSARSRSVDSSKSFELCGFSKTLSRLVAKVTLSVMRFFIFPIGFSKNSRLAVVFFLGQVAESNSDPVYLANSVVGTLITFADVLGGESTK